MRYERRKNGEVIGNDVVEFRMRYFFRFEIEHLLARAGFDEVRIFGRLRRASVRLRFGDGRGGAVKSSKSSILGTSQSPDPL